MKTMGFIGCILFLNCTGLKLKSGESNFINQNIYDIQVGDTLKIYYSTNSCCEYCIANRSKLRNISLIDDILVQSANKNCAGCNSVHALLFLAENKGMDTICGKIITASQSCLDSLECMDEFIVNVK